jgi:hypothetical protein
MKNSLTQEEQSMLLETLKERFQKFPKRHPQISWDEVVHKLLESPQEIMEFVPNGKERWRARPYYY